VTGFQTCSVQMKNVSATKWLMKSRDAKCFSDQVVNEKS
jgi:hypothetical protein